MADLTRMHAALQAADAAGDTAAATQIAQAIRASQGSAQIPAQTPVQPQAQATTPAIPLPRGRPGLLQAAAGLGETALNFGAGMVSAPISGLAGIGAMATNAVGLTNTPAADVVEGVGNAITSWSEPRTQAGRDIQSVVQYPFAKLQQGADAVGNVVNNATDSPALATGVNTAIQMLPALFLRGRAKSAPASAKMTPAQVATEAATKAEEFVRTRTSLDWNSLSTAVKARLADISKDAAALDKLDPKSVERQAQLESLPAPVRATRGQLTRDPVQLRNEGNVSATEAGKPIRETYVDQTKALLSNLDILKGRVSGQGKTRATAETPEQVGRSVQDDALRAKADASKRKYDFLYKKARAIEPEAAVHAGPLQNMLQRNPEVQHLGFMQSWFSKAGIGGPTKQVPLLELQDLREKAGGIARAGGTDGYYAGQVVKAIDESMEQVPAAAKAWKEAQGAFKKHKTEFEEQGAVERLVTDKSRTDRATALEDTWRKTVIGGSIDDLQKVKRSLLTGGDATTRTAGKKAFRDIQAQTVQHIINEATKSVTRYEDGTPNLTPASMERAIKSIGPDKLKALFGPQVVAQLSKIMEATRLVKTEPPTGFKGSPTFANAIAFLEKSIGKIPFVGDTVVGTAKAVTKLRELGASSREVQKAKTTPLDEGAANALYNKRSGERRNQLRSAAPYAPATQRDR